MGDGYLTRRAPLLLVLALASCEGKLVDLEDRGGAIAGRVVDAADGAAVVGATVTTSPDVGQATTDGAGRYRIIGIPLEDAVATVSVTATRDGFEPATAAVELSVSRPSVTLDLILPRLEHGAAAEDLQVTVTDLTGKPIAQAVVWALDLLGRNVAAGVTDGQGQVGLPLAPGRYRIHARGTGALARSEGEVGFDVQAAPTQTLTIALGAFDVRVRAAREVPRSCAAASDTVEFRVEVINAESATLPAVVFHDTLDARFGRPLTTQDIVVDRERFPGASVRINPDGLSFEVRLGPLPPTDGWIEAFHVTLPTLSAGVWCDRVSARAETSTRTTLVARQTSCVASTLALVLAVENDDGVEGEGARFLSEKEAFGVGDGGNARPEALVYRLLVGNVCPHDVSLAYTSLRVVDELISNAGVLAFREILPGYPTLGRIVSTEGDRFTWAIDKLLTGQTAELRFRAEALRPGSAVNRVEVTATELAGTVRNEEPTTVIP